MEQNETNTAVDDSTLKTLWVLLSALGLLIIIGSAGFFFFSPDKAIDDGKPVLAATALVEPQKQADEFDPIEWSRESDEYPGLEEEDAIDVELVAPDEASEPEVVEAPEPAAAEQAPPVKPAVKEPSYKEVTVQVYWIQVGSYSSLTKAESVSDYMAEKGLNSTVQTKNVDGKAVFRVRIGAFNTKEEAEKFSTQVKTIDGYEESFVIRSGLVKRIPVNS